MRADRIQLHFGPHLPAHQVDQNNNPLIVGSTLELANMIREGPRDNLNLGALLKRHISAGKDQATIIFIAPDLFYQSGRDRDRATVTADKMQHADSRIYRPPSLIRPWHGDKKIGRKEGARFPAYATRMTDPAKIPRQIDFKALPLQMMLCLCLGIRVRSSNVPATG